jgi:hypothetical protein
MTDIVKEEWLLAGINPANILTFRIYIIL